MLYQKNAYFCSANPIGVWCSWLAFLHGVQAVARSSRATPTRFFKNWQRRFLKRLFFFVYIIFLLISLLHLFTVWMLSSRMAAISLLLRSEQERSRTFASVSLRLGYLC